MKPKIRVIIEMAVEQGVKQGYSRAFKHNENPSKEVICDHIEEQVIESLHEYFTFDDEDFS
jgi:hypothetical protein